MRSRCGSRADLAQLRPRIGALTSSSFPARTCAIRVLKPPGTVRIGSARRSRIPGDDHFESPDHQFSSGVLAHVRCSGRASDLPKADQVGPSLAGDGRMPGDPRGSPGARFPGPETGRGGRRDSRRCRSDQEEIRAQAPGAGGDDRLAERVEAQGREDHDRGRLVTISCRPSWESRAGSRSTRIAGSRSGPAPPA